MANIYVKMSRLFAIELKLLCFSLEWMATNNWVIMLFPVEGGGISMIKYYSLESHQMVPFVSRPE